MFFIGMVSYKILIILNDVENNIFLGLLLLITGVFLLCSFSMVQGAEKIIDLRIPIAMSYAIVIIGCGLFRPKILDSGVLRYYGKVSYSIYLAHAPIVVFISNRIIVKYELLGYFGYAISLILVLLMVSTVAYLLYRFVESPFNRLGRKLAQHFAVPMARSLIP